MEERIKAILVDDESKSRTVMRSLLENFSAAIELVGEAANIDTAFDLIQMQKPQLVFLDIQMPRGNGFDLLKKFEEVPFEVIFVTSFDKYAISAIKFSALDYLLKPVEVNDLKDAVEKAIKTIGQKQDSGKQIVNLLHSLDANEKDLKIAVQVGKNIKLINTSNIVYIESDGLYCNITTVNNERFIIAKYLKEFEDYFGDTSSFVRIHRSCLLNVTQIKGYNVGEPCIIEMMTGKTFEVARRKKQEVLERLKK